MRDKVLHGKRRRVVSQAFSEATMRSFEPKIVEKIQRLCDTITKSLGVDGWSETKDMGRYCESTLNKVSTTLRLFPMLVGLC
jgi:cytochrome P450